MMMLLLLFIYVVVVVDDDDDDHVENVDGDFIAIVNVVFVIFVLVVVVIFAYQCLPVTECSPSGSGHIQLRSSQQAESYQRPVGSNTSSAL